MYHKEKTAICEVFNSTSTYNTFDSGTLDMISFADPYWKRKIYIQVCIYEAINCICDDKMSNHTNLICPRAKWKRLVAKSLFDIFFGELVLSKKYI